MRGPLAVIAIVALLVAIGLLPLVRSRSSGEHHFVAAAWRSASEPVSTCSNNRRAEMADDLITHHLKLGMTPLQVHQLLGSPYAYKRYGAEREEWWPTGGDGNHCTLLSVSYRDGHFTDVTHR
jgi:outer membrane protein assembly factor BamE (lipoprotein component of BamABCDE complex)